MASKEKWAAALVRRDGPKCCRPANVGEEKGRPGAGARRESGPSVGLLSCPFRERREYFHAATRRYRYGSHVSDGVASRTLRHHYGYAGEHHGRCARPGAHRRAARTLAWWWLVAACVLVLVLVAAALLAVWWAHYARDAHHHLPRARRPRGRAAGPRRRRRGDRRRRDRGRGPARRRVRVRPARRSSAARSHDGTLTIISRCPDQVLGSCHASFRADRARQRAARDRDVLAASSASRACAPSVAGHHRLGRRSPRRASAASRCARSRTPATSTSASECSAERLELRSRSGDVHAVVPAGRYQIDAQSDTGHHARARRSRPSTTRRSRSRR